MIVRELKFLDRENEDYVKTVRYDLQDCSTAIEVDVYDNGNGRYYNIHIYTVNKDGSSNVRLTLCNTDPSELKDIFQSAENLSISPYEAPWNPIQP